MCSAAVVNSDRTRFSEEIAALNMKPLWERVMRLKAGTAAVPAIWRWKEVRPLLERACELITAKEAERRVLMLENPALADFVVTPGWTWHDHGNVGTKPVVWLDGLDTAFANLFGAHFREDYPEESQAASRPEGDSAARYGANLLPVDRGPQGRASPVLSYPYERTRAALEQLSKDGDPHPSHGWKLRYANPATGGHAFPTMAVFMQWLPRGFSGREYRSTDGAVFCVVEGQGGVDIGETHFDLAPRDVFVVPSWEPYRFGARADCVIFSYSDRAAQEALGFWREET